MAPRASTRSSSTLSGEAVEEGIVCGSAIVARLVFEDLEGDALTRQDVDAIAGESTDFVWYDELTCEDGSGYWVVLGEQLTAVADMNMGEANEAATSWTVKRGTGDYTTLIGQGSDTVDFVRGAIDKLTQDVPQFFLDGWADTWAASFPGLELSWRIAGVVEAASAVVLLVSIVLLEWLPGRPKAWAKIGVGLGLVLFMMLAWGQQLIGATEGIANVWLYFGTAAATMVILQLDDQTTSVTTTAATATPSRKLRPTRPTAITHISCE